MKRLYIPLPEQAARVTIVKSLLLQIDNNLSEEDIQSVAEQTHG